MNRKNEKVRGYQWSSASAFQKSREFLNVNLDDCAPLSAPVIVPDPEDVLFPDDRARKRRRVESLVQGFLHGSPLRITSARPSPTSLKLTVEQDKRRVHGKPYKLRPAQKPAKAELTLDDMKVLKPISVEQKSKEATLDLGNDSKNLLHMDQHPSIFGQMSRNKSYSPVNKNSAAVVGKNFCTDISNQAGSASPSHIEHLKLSRLVDGGDQRGGSPSNAKVDPLLPIRHQPFLLPTSDSPNVVPSEHQNRQPVFPQNLNHQTEPSNLSKSAIISQAAYPPSRSVAQQSNGTHSSGPYTFIPPDNGERSISTIPVHDRHVSPSKYAALAYDQCAAAVASIPSSRAPPAKPILLIP
ncbi:hypothetical protein K470DRAFT_270211 [Piedraia hortae CBS 480.64]|uniref:Uncharacterized protein n=1 Tax=Piedraia hortae CBS 480.64 TaxID=1314780 RepID=A0A6A7C2P8_9PEZI|nr:hypothetical protein K470DRAFT_270211 [Piedraia hortae CBS 480.64]